VYSEYFSSLEEITLSLESDVCLKYFIFLTDIYAERIKTLTLRLKFSPKFTQVGETFEQISRFCNLKKIDLKIESNEKLDLNFSQGVELLSKNCLNLKDISLEIKGNISSSTTVLKAFESISDVETLKLIIKSANLCLGTFDSLESFRNLTELYVLYRHLNDDLLDNLHSYCPKLVSIELLTLQELTDKTLYYLAKIGSLKRIKISSMPYRVYDITDSGVIDVLNRCDHLRVLDFKCCINITKQTFFALKTLAEYSPKSRIKFSFCWKNSENSFTEQGFDLPGAVSILELWPEVKDSPKNLIINGRGYLSGKCGSPRVNERILYRKLFGDF